MTDRADYTLVAVIGCKEITETISAPDVKTARKAFWRSLTDEQRDATESIELIEVNHYK